MTRSIYRCSARMILCGSQRAQPTRSSTIPLLDRSRRDSLRSVRTSHCCCLLLAAAPALGRSAAGSRSSASSCSRPSRQAPCFEDKFEQKVWLAAMEPKLKQLVKDRSERADILHHVFCEARRLQLPPGLVMAVIDVESRFDRWAVSCAGAVGPDAGHAVLAQPARHDQRRAGAHSAERAHGLHDPEVLSGPRERRLHARRSPATTAASAAATTPTWC